MSVTLRWKWILCSFEGPLSLLWQLIFLYSLLWIVVWFFLMLLGAWGRAIFPSHFILPGFLLHIRRLTHTHIWPPLDSSLDYRPVLNFLLKSSLAYLPGTSTSVCLMLRKKNSKLSLQISPSQCHCHPCISSIQIPESYSWLSSYSNHLFVHHSSLTTLSLKSLPSVSVFTHFYCIPKA